MSRWYLASNITPADDQSIQAVPNPGAYTDLDDGDKCILDYEDNSMLYKYVASSSAAELLPFVITPDGNSGNGRWIKMDYMPKGQNGFDVGRGPDTTSATLGFVDGTRTFTITPTGASFRVFINGAPFSFTTAQSVVIPDLEGLHWIYFDEDGVLKSLNPGLSSVDLILDKCLVANVYWDATNNVSILLGEERHGSSMSPLTHYHLHETVGALFEAGLSTGNITSDGSGDVDSHAQCSVTDGEFHDEDNQIVITNGSPQTLSPIGQFPIFYRLGAGGLWRKTIANNFPVTTTGSGRAAWNENVGGTWQLTEVDNNDFVLCHLFATNNIAEPIIAIMGQGEYNTLGQARTGAETEIGSLAFGQVQEAVQEFVPIASIIFQTSNGYANAVMSRVRTTDTGDDYIDWRRSPITGSGSSTADHESLSGLLGGAAADHWHLTQAQHTDLTGEIIDGSDTDLHQHDTLEYNTITSVEAVADGVVISDTSGSHTSARFKNDIAVDLARIYAAAAQTQLRVGSADEVAINAAVNGSVGLYYNNIKEAETASGALKATNALQIGSSLLADDILDEDNMASDSATALVTQQSIKAYVDTVVLEGGNPNITINGDFNNWQRGTSFAAIAHTDFNADRFRFCKSSTAVHTVERSTDVPTFAESGYQSNYSSLLDCTTLDAEFLTTDNVCYDYLIEGYDFAPLQGNYGTLSFWVKATKTGTYCVGFSNSGFDRSYIVEYTVNVSDTWEKKTIIVNFNETGGTWDYTDGTGLQIRWVLAAGATLHTTPDAWQTGTYLATSNQVNACDSTANNFLLSQVKLEKGQIVTPWKARPFAEELALCQRYCNVFTEGHFFSGWNRNTTSNVYNLDFPNPMRGVPTLTYTAASTFAVRQQNSVVVPSTVGGAFGGNNAMLAHSATCVGLTAGEGTAFVIGSGGKIIVDAEL